MSVTTSQEIQGLSVAFDDMVWIPGGTISHGFQCALSRRGAGHRVSVDSFWIDRTPVTNGLFKQFVRKTGHVTFAERKPDAKDYPNALPRMLFAGSLVFTPPRHPVDLRDWSQWWTLLRGANWRHPYGRKSDIHGLDDHPVVHVAYSDALAYAQWPVRTCRPRPNGSLPRAADLTAPNSPGAMN